MRALPAHKRAEQTGMTLVEVMVAMVLTAILLVGMNALWVEISREVDALVLRQKAIFRANGEMERLTGLYAAGSATVVPTPSGSAVSVMNYNTTGAPANQGDYIGTTASVPVTNTTWVNESNSDRFIYPPPSSSPPVPPWMVDDSGMYGNFGDVISSVATEKLSYGDGSLSSIDTVFGRVFYWNAATTTHDDDRNIVWIDREKNIVGQISWSSVQLDPTTYTCGTDPCRHITLYLDYPFRYSSAASPKEEIPGFPVSTITLQTIASRRP